MRKLGAARRFLMRGMELEKNMGKAGQIVNKLVYTHLVNFDELGISTPFNPAFSNTMGHSSALIRHPDRRTRCAET